MTDAEWEVRDAAARARDALDWRRLRFEALEPLRDERAARWHAFDFAAGKRSDGSYAFEAAPSTCVPASIVLVDGAYSARPELRDLCEVRVLTTSTSPVRESRLRARESAEFLQAWHARWDAAVELYFTLTSRRAVSISWSRHRSTRCDHAFLTSVAAVVMKRLAPSATWWQC